MIRRWTLHVDVGCGVLADGPHDDVDVDGIEVIELAPVVERILEVQTEMEIDGTPHRAIEALLFDLSDTQAREGER